MLSRTWCGTHWARWRRQGDPNICTTNRHIPMLDRFWMKVQKGAGCWTWTGSQTNGYGRFAEGYGKKNHPAHRFAYELKFGPVPEGKMLDHKCHNRICVNPDHLRPVTHKQNMEHKTGAHRTSSTGVLGVHQRKDKPGYIVKVGHNGNRVYGGKFDDLQEAAEAARQLRIELFTHNDFDRISA